MIIGCTLPLLLIFFVPALGLNSNRSTFIFIVAMFACHLLMPMHQQQEEAILAKLNFSEGIKDKA